MGARKQPTASYQGAPSAQPPWSTALGDRAPVTPGGSLLTRQPHQTPGPEVRSLNGEGREGSWLTRLST